MIYLPFSVSPSFNRPGWFGVRFDGMQVRSYPTREEAEADAARCNAEAEERDRLWKQALKEAKERA